MSKITKITGSYDAPKWMHLTSKWIAKPVGKATIWTAKTAGKGLVKVGASSVKLAAKAIVAMETAKKEAKKAVAEEKASKEEIINVELDK